MKSPRSLATIVLLMFLGTGCSTIKGWLRPWVCADGACDCRAPDKTIAAVPKHVDDELAGNTIPSDAIADDANAEAKQGRVASSPTQPKLDPYEVVGVDVADSVVDLSSQAVVSGLRESFSSKKDYFRAENFGVRGRFSKRGVDELAVIDGVAITILNARGKVASADTPKGLAIADGLPRPVVSGARLVRDGRLEVVALTQSQGTDSIEVFMTVYKVIGREVGTVFDQKLGEVQEGKFVPFFQVRVLRGDRDPFLEVSPVREGEADTSKRVIYHWNHWEGVFRVPSNPPSAPKRS